MPPLFMDSRSEGSVESFSGEESHSPNNSVKGREGRGSGDGKGKRRQTNRNAARKSRKKQTQRADVLHQELQFLERSNSALEKEIASLRQDFQRYSTVLGQHEPFCPLTSSSSCQTTNSLPSSSFVDVLPSSSSPAGDQLCPSSSSSSASSAPSSPPPSAPQTFPSRTPVLPLSRASGPLRTSVGPPITPSAASPGNTHPPQGAKALSSPSTAGHGAHLVPTSSSSSSRRHGNTFRLLSSVTDAQRRCSTVGSNRELRSTSSVTDPPRLQSAGHSDPPRLQSAGHSDPPRLQSAGHSPGSGLVSGSGTDLCPIGTDPSLLGPAGWVRGHSFLSSPPFLPLFPPSPSSSTSSSFLMFPAPCSAHLLPGATRYSDSSRSQAVSVPFWESTTTPEVAPATVGCPPAYRPNQSNTPHSILSLLTCPSPLVAPPTMTSDLIAPPTDPQPITPLHPVLTHSMSSSLSPFAGPAAELNLDEFLDENDWVLDNASLGLDMLL